MLQGSLQEEKGRRKSLWQGEWEEEGEEKGGYSFVVCFSSPSWLILQSTLTRPLWFLSVLLSPTSIAFFTIHNSMRALGCSFLVLNVLCDLCQSETEVLRQFVARNKEIEASAGAVLIALLTVSSQDLRVFSLSCQPPLPPFLSWGIGKTDNVSQCMDGDQ